MKNKDREKLQGLQNPFMASTVIQCRSYKSVNKMVSVADVSDGVILGDVSEIKSRMLVDADDYTKVFTKPGYRLHVSALNNQGKALFLWLLFEIDYAEDFFELNKRRFIAENGSSYQHLSFGVKALMDASIITPTSVDNVYWINPIFFFKGDRIKMYPDNLAT